MNTLHPTALLGALPLVLGCAATAASVPPSAVGWRQLERRDAAGALRTFDRALATAADAELHGGRARALFLLGRQAEARQSYDDAIALDPTNAQWLIGLCLVELACDDARAAAAACDAALAVDPTCAKAYYNRGLAYLHVGENARALCDFEDTVRIAPDHAGGYNGRGVVLARLDRLEEALASFRSAALLAPTVEAHTNCAAAHYALGEVEDALTELNAAIRLDRNSPHAYASRGRIYLDLREPELAIPDLERAFALDPNSRALVRWLQEARASADDHDGRSD